MIEFKLIYGGKLTGLCAGDVAVLRDTLIRFVRKQTAMDIRYRGSPTEQTSLKFDGDTAEFRAEMEQIAKRNNLAIVPYNASRVDLNAYRFVEVSLHALVGG